MAPSVAQLMRALPEQLEAEEVSLPEPWAAVALRPVPVGRWRRLRLLGTLQAQIGAAYLFYWIRGWFLKADQKELLLAETRWKTALRLLDSMSYLRGAVMKVGQTLANFPDIVPREFIAALDHLHFDAPPMHWSLLREMVCNELGDDPDNLFESFEKRAFAAASLGQLHRARLKGGQEVAVKIQYPGIARTVREDFRNLSLFLLPGRLCKDWENTKDQFDDLRARLERETDYEAEAATLAKVRPLFRDEDGIAVPRVYPQHSTARILTMECLSGVHLEEFLARGPSQEQRDEFGRKILRAWYRLFYTGRMNYADPHPGNFLFMDDGRLGLIDFGLVMTHNDDEWAIIRRMDRAMTTGQREDRHASVKEWSWITDEPADADRLRVSDEYTQWCWRCRYQGGPFDFGDETDFRRGIDLFTEMLRKRYSRARPCTPVIAYLGLRSVLYRLKANIDVRHIAEEEVKATGWDRSDYAPR